MTTKQLGVLASGGGTTLQAILDAIDAGALSAEVAVVISNNSRSGAAERARRHGIPFQERLNREHAVSSSVDHTDANRCSPLYSSHHSARMFFFPKSAR